MRFVVIVEATCVRIAFAAKERRPFDAFDVAIAKDKVEYPAMAMVAHPDNIIGSGYRPPNR